MMSVSNLVDVLVEIPKGSQNKYEYDKEKGQIRLDRVLHSSVHYPGDYGYIPETLGEDGDPLDAILLVTSPTFPGCLVESAVVGCLRMQDEKGSDLKILCVPTGDPRLAQIRCLADVPHHSLMEIRHFFAAYKFLEGKEVEITGWGEADEALTHVAEARARHLAQVAAGNDSATGPSATGR